MEIREIYDANTADFSEAIKIYVDNFEPNVRHPVELIYKRFFEDRYRLFVGKQEKDIIVFALVYRSNDPDFLLLDYYAVRTDYRDKGIGTEFLKELFKVLRLNEKGIVLIFEVEDPNFGDNREERIRRVRFYKSLGVRQIKDMRYIFPPLSGNKRVDMILMMYPCPSRETISREILINLVKELYIEKYNRDSSDPLLLETLSTIPQKIRFK